MGFRCCSLYQEVWKSGKLYEYPVGNLDNVKTTSGPLKDGWGVTTDQASLIMSDGSPTLTWVDPTTLAVQRTVSVRHSTFTFSTSTYRTTPHHTTAPSQALSLP